MNRTLTIKFGLTEKKAAFVLTTLVLAFVALTMAQDFLRSGIKSSVFYFSESLMFSSFWWIFAPFLFAQYFIIKYKNSKQLACQLALIVWPILLHLLAFPFLVWALSKAFYYHTYSFQQTFRFTLSEYLYFLVIFYTIPVLFFHYFARKTKSAIIPEIVEEAILNEFVTTFLVSEGNRKRAIPVSEILYFSANTPYINIHLDGKKHLHNETLKSISINLNPEQFVRVHKSTIVNIEMVASYTTRLNGDYDLTMKNNMQLRLSRNFASDFKNLYNKTHRFTTK